MLFIIDDHIFFRIPHQYLASYNKQQAEWNREILAHGACRQEGGRIWYGGRCLLNGLTEEFDEDCSTELLNLANTFLWALDTSEQFFAYTENDIDHLSCSVIT